MLVDRIVTFPPQRAIFGFGQDGDRRNTHMKNSLLIVALLLPSAPIGAQKPLEVIRVTVSEPVNPDA